MYEIISTLFWFIRQFLMPNPFEILGDGIMINIGDTPFLLTPALLNWIAGLFLPLITFAFVGIYYRKNSEPALGSILYMFLFIIHTLLLYLICCVYSMIWLIVLICIAYIGIHIMVYSFVNKNVL